jgi:hypothetical protein
MIPSAKDNNPMRGMIFKKQAANGIDERDRF